MNGAIFSECRTWRSRLWRESIIGRGRVVAVMLNPSTADEATNDPTVERVWRRAQMLGFRRLDVVNIFAFRSTDPKGLYAAADPVGPDNDAAILDACTGADLVLCGWGEHGAYRGRGAHVRNALTSAGIALHVLDLNRSGNPKHPLYVGYNAKPFLWEIANA